MEQTVRLDPQVQQVQMVLLELLAPQAILELRARLASEWDLRVQLELQVLMEVMELPGLLDQQVLRAQTESMAQRGQLEILDLQVRMEAMEQLVLQDLQEQMVLWEPQGLQEPQALQETDFIYSQSTTPYGSTTVRKTITVTTTATDRVLLLGEFDFAKDASASYVSFGIWRGATELVETSALSSANADNNCFAQWVDTPGAGTWTYTIMDKAGAGGYSIVYGSMITAIVFK
jgi:hypothetical protein